MQSSYSHFWIMELTVVGRMELKRSWILLRSSSVYRVSCSSFLLLAAAHKHDIFSHFLNGLPVLPGLCRSLLLYHCPPRCASKLSFRPPHRFISLCCLLLSSSYCHLTTNLRDRQSHGTLERMQAGKEGKLSLMNPLGLLSLRHWLQHRHPEEVRRSEDS